MAKRKPSSDPADPDPRWTFEQTPAPGDLRIVQAFLNTPCPIRETDFENPQALVDWLGLWDLATPSAEFDDGDLKRALEVRKMLRTLVAAAQIGENMNDEDLAIFGRTLVSLDQAMASATVRMRFGSGGRIRFESAPDGLDGALARLCAIVAAAQLEGTWSHMKICIGKNCHAVFFDSSKNHRGKWCTPKCSSRSTSLRYRRRNLKRIREQDYSNAMTRRFNRKHGL